LGVHPGATHFTSVFATNSQESLRGRKSSQEIYLVGSGNGRISCRHLVASVVKRLQREIVCNFGVLCHVWDVDETEANEFGVEATLVMVFSALAKTWDQGTPVE
jgi:hypothetical protein